MNHFAILFVLFLSSFHITAGEQLAAGNARVLRYPPQSRGLLSRVPEASVNHLSGVASLQLKKARDTCYHEDQNVCAELMVGGNVIQQIHINDDGCTPLSDASDITAINVYNCWCGLWSASDSGACNNGDDEVVDQLNSCAGLQTRDGRGWQYTPTHISCYRPS